jgi:hypothetical protein
MNYALSQLSPGIFFIEIEDAFDLSIFFLRVQEYYESPYKQIKGKNFTLLEYMKVYSEDKDNAFTYVQDWSGFNVPGKQIDKLYSAKNISKIKDFNPYDEKMKELHKVMSQLNEYKKTIAPRIIDLQELSNKSIVKHKDYTSNLPLSEEILFAKGTNVKVVNNIVHKERHNTHYYLIGALPGDTSTLKHELCHAFFSLYPQYKTDTLLILSTLSVRILDKISKWLLELGYSKEVMDDEIQAYLTNDYDDILIHVEFTKNEHKKVISVSDKLRENFFKYVKVKS